MTYLDRSFCSSSSECSTDCYRRLWPREQRPERTRDMCVSYADYRGGDQCPGFTPKPEAKEEA